MIVLNLPNDALLMPTGRTMQTMMSLPPERDGRDRAPLVSIHRPDCHEARSVDLFGPFYRTHFGTVLGNRMKILLNTVALKSFK